MSSKSLLVTENWSTTLKKKHGLKCPPVLQCGVKTIHGFEKRIKFTK